jgi:hypothetical protein
MALVISDRVKETSATTGTGALTLAGAMYGFQAFTVVGNGNVTYYAIYDNASGNWEVGYGTYTAAGPTLSRDFVYDSSSGVGVLVNFGVGTKEVFVTYPADQAVYQEVDGSLKLVGGQITLTLDGTLGATLPNTTFQAFSTVNTYIQTNQQNLSSGAAASSDTVLTADNGTDSTNYIDMGIASSGYNDPAFPALLPNSGFLVSTGADLRIQTGTNGVTVAEDKDIVFNAGLLTLAGERMRIKGLSGNVIIDGIDPVDTGEKFQVYGSSKITGAAEFGSTVLLSANPTLDLQASTKQYVDNAVSAGLTIHEAVRLEEGSNLAATYNQPGGSGVGATLTNAGTQAALVIDGIATVVNNRVLIYGQTTATQNGAYTVTNIGSGSTNWVLTRSTDADTYGVASPFLLSKGSYFYVQEGTTGAGESYVVATAGTITFGTTAIEFSQFSASPVLTGTAPLNVTGQVIALTGVVDAPHGGTGISGYATGDVLYATSPTTLAKLAIGANGQVVISGGTAPQWGSLDLAGVGVSGTLAAIHGGTSQNSYIVGDMLYSSATNTLTKLAGNITTSKKFLAQTGTGAVSADPIWDALTSADVSGLAPSATIDTTDAANITSGTLPSGRLIGGYTGISAVGTLVNGTWNANTIGIAYGGTGATTVAAAQTNLQVDPAGTAIAMAIALG